MKEILAHLFEYKAFTRKEAYDILINITEGKYDTHQVAAFMTAYGMRSIRVEELAGFRDAMYDLCKKLDLSAYRLIDLCGTGGDGKNTFNISTLASFVVAGAGYQVAKHGNIGVSSGCGSSNVMEYLGYSFTNDEGEIRRQLDEANICFLHAPLFHPAMKTVAPIRRALGVKTFFNMLGPLTNPANPQFQSVGVFSLELARLYAYLYQHTNKQYAILHALDGYDEISLTGDFKVIDNKGEHYYTVAQLGFEAIHPETISGGDTVDEAGKIFMDILNGEGNDIQQNVVLSNAAMAIKTFNPDRTFADCYYEAEESLLGKKALSSFKKLIN
ncbi:anthranilate phosphoribosyltransferase [Sphingobacterium spiritivorum]|uniref:Anthranilate phosphoribosyltransferase n=1 Tax=Sphingobacterium spiritivorum ATCC 33861 TaxID=525373 RepID=D7VGM9_SPHSI|nr:anthranilate phosphoribosyltransferase [Sphingobacterium spiritivorum]EFK59231.1 anthranilate phosphoribosyltransferase [Sphingobacterium spiritivorum ATCC 33861]QQT34066.1 anthranilate phosphoribosyltransferase [Sphingobacterium spiritivorum]WQD34895.1 anthranilate phosphoribosyltransferase [Sphingobacterium spiritivorum]SUI98625.1 Anthranilate phosphoribosyltransferase 2 [Sphingobacterium spiritivorum]